MNDISDAWDIGISLLDDGKSENREVHADDAATDRLSLALTSSAWAVAGVALGEQQSDTGWVKDTLLHWETLLVVAAGDFEDVALELVADAVAWDFSAHLLVHEDTELLLVIDVDQLLGAIGRVGDIELHLDVGKSRIAQWLVVVVVFVTEVE